MKNIILLLLLTVNAFSYECLVDKNVIIIKSESTAEVIAINKIETISGMSFRGELDITLMSGKKKSYICQNNREVILQTIKQMGED